MPLIVDCYNVLHATMPPSLAGLDEARLCLLLADSPWARQRMVVVCDGVVKPGGPATSPQPGVELIYSGPGRSADEVIIRLIDADSAPRRLTVVSDDRELRKAARRRRARDMEAARFIQVLASVLGRRGKGRPGGGGAGKLTPATLSASEVEAWLKEFGLEGTAKGSGPRDQG
jgi:predicted RNA-binding protein with PIN domain